MTRDLFKLLTCSTVLAFLVGDTCVASKNIPSQIERESIGRMQALQAKLDTMKKQQAKAQEEAKKARKEKEEAERLEKEKAERLKKEAEIKEKKAKVAGLADQAGAAMHMYFDTDRKTEHLIEYNKQAEQLEVILKSLKLTGAKWEPGSERELAAYVIWHTFHIVHKSKEFSKMVDFHDSKERKEADRLTKSIKETATSVGAWPIEVEKDCAELLIGPKTATGAQQGRIESIIAELAKIDEGNAKNMRAAYKI